jgi:tRNA-specific 2-thiouridylase
MKVKALALFSGGLDSVLAVKLILSQGIAVEGIFFVNAFLPAPRNTRQAAGLPASDNAGQALQKRIAEQLGVKLHILDISRPHLTLVQQPRYGYGKNINPCIDCRILMLKQAKAYMQAHGFSFLISGEVLGQRPMSQRRDTLNIVERDAQAKGLLLRPLSAKLLKPTVAEVKGWVDREGLMDFSGRSRKSQLALAKELGVREYSTPAGGCLLTQEEFARKFRDLNTSGKVGMEDVQLLKLGRHFRCKDLSAPGSAAQADSVKIIVARDEQENKELAALADNGSIFLRMRDFAGPLTVIRTTGGLVFANGLIEAAARLTVRYSKGRAQQAAWVDYWRRGACRKESILATPAEEDLIEKMRV